MILYGSTGTWIWIDTKFYYFKYNQPYIKWRTVKALRGTF